MVFIFVAVNELERYRRVPQVLKKDLFVKKMCDILFSLNFFEVVLPLFYWEACNQSKAFFSEKCSLFDI